MTDILASAYFNFYTLGGLIPVLFLILGTVFLTRIKQKSPGTFWLTAFFLTSCLFYFAYVPASLLFHPLGAYHRWATVPLVLLVFTCFSQFYLNYPDRTHPRFARAVLIAQLALTAAAAIFFIVNTRNTPAEFRFQGHYFDFQEGWVSRIIGANVLFFVLCLVGLSVWRIITTKTSERFAVLWMTLVFIPMTIVPAVTNMLSRNDRLDHGVHMTVFVLLSILGLFSILVIFINTTRDRTTFMAKVIGISTAVFLLLFQFIAYYALGKQEDAHDQLRLRDAELALRGKKQTDTRYIIQAAPRENDGNALEPAVASAEQPAVASLARKVNRARILRELENTRMHETLRAMPVIQGESRATFRARTARVLADAPEHFRVYETLLMHGLEREADIARGGPALTGLLAKLSGELGRHAKKIARLPARDFPVALEKYIQRHESLKPAADLLMRAARDGSAGRARVLSYLDGVRAPGGRVFRRSRVGGFNPDHFVGFAVMHPVSGEPVEVGFSYRAYRRFLDPSARGLILLLALALLVVGVGFPIFFRGSLLAPLRVLVDGMQRADAGELDIELPVRVEDEIGYLSRSFNGMITSIAAARARLREYADQLQDKVEERTAELNRTLVHVRELKSKQDGDYFLTSLLLKPLSTIENGGEAVRVNSLVRQHKQFEFQKWREEIGGDLNKAHRIQLRGDDYTVFLNGDAMGKSMQGAGGALVLGAVFQAIVQRARMSPEVRDLHPERWLKNAFIELHSVFEGFDGSMLVSLVLGLIDEKRGVLYHVNAEHPWMVLYRGGRASFVDEDGNLLRKLGTPGIEGDIAIGTLRLRAGDVLISGSDGRDDLHIGESNGVRNVNNDERQFLRVVEEAQGEPEGIYRGLLERGSLTDDLSILLLTYNPPANGHPGGTGMKRMLESARRLADAGQVKDAIEALEYAGEPPEGSPAMLGELARLHLSIRSYEAAAGYAARYLELRPADTRMFFAAAVCTRRAGKFRDAVELGERARLRQPTRVDNLINLAKAYACVENRARSRDLLETVLRLEPENAKALQLLRRGAVDSREAGPAQSRAGAAAVT